jgi:hypothetical protein
LCFGDIELSTAARDDADVIFIASPRSQMEFGNEGYTTKHSPCYFRHIGHCDAGLVSKSSSVFIGHVAKIAP